MSDERDDPESIAVGLRHSSLPRLDELGALTSDHDQERVIYRGGSCSTEMIDRTRVHERING